MPKRELDYHPLTLRNIPGNRYFFQEDGSSLYSYMFVEDVTTHIIPYHEHSSFSDRSFLVNISDQSLETEVKALFHISYGYDPINRPLSEAVFGFIRDVASFLLAKGGKAYFEIVDGIFRYNEITKQVYVLHPIGGKVTRFGKTYYQIIPKEVKEVKERFIAIPQSKVWALEPPRDWGRAKDIIALSNKMKELGNASFLGSKIVTNQKDFFGFEYQEFKSLIDAAVLQVTIKWGWDMRMGISNKYALEYYRYYRMLRFGYSMAILRSDLLSKMNSLLHRLGYDVTLSFSGIPTPEEFLDAIKKMEKRELSFNDAFNLSYL